MEESDISVYSNLTSVNDTVLNIISTNDLIPKDSKNLKITDTFYTYGYIGPLNTFIPTGSTFSGGWAAFCPAFSIFSGPVNKDGSSQTSPTAKLTTKTTVKPTTTTVKPATTTTVKPTTRTRQPIG